jgi:hypothetical protein
MLDEDDLALGYMITNGTEACYVGKTHYSRDTGNLIEAFAVLADLTGDSKWLNAYEKFVYSATQKAAWNGNDGVITEGSDMTDPDDVDIRAMKGMASPTALL